ncbi:MAG: ETC complex I subunit, partial [Erythrobacter sp.]|nr:ETC complex I subunit [Erythrobacter sp.]
ARAYAEKYGIPARVIATPPKRLKLQAYADNFR